MNLDEPTQTVEVIYALRFIAEGHPVDKKPPTAAGLAFGAWNNMYGNGEDGESTLTAKGQGFLDRFGFLNPELDPTEAP